MLKNKLVIGKFSDMVKQAPRFKKKWKCTDLLSSENCHLHVILPPSMHCTLSCPRVNILSWGKNDHPNRIYFVFVISMHYLGTVNVAIPQ